MIVSDTVKSILENDKELCKSVINTLLKIANNIINHPQDAKFRKINLNADVTQKVLIPSVGALETLFVMGFEEGTDTLMFPENASLDNITLYRDQLEKLKRENLVDNYSQNWEESSKPITMKKLSDSTIALYVEEEAKLKAELQTQFQKVLMFERPYLQEDAQECMPHKMLSQKAKERETALASHKDGKQPCFDYQDCLLVELLQWFKEEFFSWFDKGYCETCSRTMDFVGYVAATEEELLYGGHRVEKYECQTCSNFVRFPRFFHPGQLLKTRKGRCMEWASCFTLLCRTLGLDARYVWDQTDHVWTEVFSVSQNRWIHADPCENKLDCPLMYEGGWGKKLSYIFAFSKDEIVDCVWRYSANHKDVRKRRVRAREDALAVILSNLNTDRQKLFPEHKKKYLELRLLKELVSFTVQPKISKEGESEGRLSGSLDWRLSRGETSGKENTDSKEFIFAPTVDEIAQKEMIVKYSSAQNCYLRDNSKEAALKDWKSGLFSFKNLFRKHEKDWKMVYICRNEGVNEGSLSWEFDWSTSNLQLTSLLVVLQHNTYEDGAVTWDVCSGDLCFPGKKDGVIQLSKSDFGDNIKSITISASLLNGKGDVAWQHAQLFRQSENDKEFPFFVKLKFL